MWKLRGRTHHRCHVTCSNWYHTILYIYHISYGVSSFSNKGLCFMLWISVVLHAVNIYISVLSRQRKAYKCHLEIPWKFGAYYRGSFFRVMRAALLIVILASGAAIRTSPPPLCMRRRGKIDKNLCFCICLSAIFGHLACGRRHSGGQYFKVCSVWGWLSRWDRKHCPLLPAGLNMLREPLRWHQS